MSDTLYDLLGIDPGASQEQIAEAIRTQRRKWSKMQAHPDLARRQLAEQRVQELAQIEKTLGDPAARTAYDTTLPGGARSPSQDPTPATPSASTSAPPSPDASDADDRPWEPRPGAAPGASAPLSGQAVNAWFRAHKGLSALLGAGVVALVIVIVAVSAGSASAPVAVSPDGGSGSNAVSQPQSQDDGSSSNSDSSTTPDSSPSTPAAGDTQVVDLSQLSPEYSNGGLYSNDSPVDLSRQSAFTPDDSTLAASGQTVSTSTVVSAVTSGGEAYAALAEVDSPAVDLTPATTADQLILFGEDGAVTGRVTLHSSPGTSYDGPDYSLTGSSTSTVLVSGDPGDGSEPSLTGFDVSTGKEIWATTGQVDHTAEGIAVVSADDGTDSDGDTCSAVRGLSLTTGAVAWTVSKASITDGSSCDEVSLADQDLGDVYVAIEVGQDTIVVRSATGRRVAWRGENDFDNIAIDPQSGEVFSGADDTQSAEVYNPNTGKKLWEMSSAQAQNLDLQVHGLSGGLIYASTTDQNVLIDVATGKTVAGGWTASPESLVGTDQLLFSDGTLRPVSSVAAGD